LEKNGREEGRRSRPAAAEAATVTRILNGMIRRLKTESFQNDLRQGLESQGRRAWGKN